uniref:Uncharacterized protein n=1 Tax=Brugia timori TaxID=42155 RepID=A0A0R3R9M8_9BILA
MTKIFCLNFWHCFNHFWCQPVIQLIYSLFKCSLKLSSISLLFILTYSYLSFLT